MMRTGLALSALLATVGVVRPLAAQQTGDQARLVMTVSGAYIGGRELWTVPTQTLGGDAGRLDSLSIRRDAGGTLGAAFSGIYFPDDHIGLGAEAVLLGLNYNDQCQVTSANVAGQNATLCRLIPDGGRSSVAVVLSTGVIFRVASRKVISPYARANAGLLFNNLSSVRVEVDDPTPQGLQLLTLYPDAKNSRVSGAFGLGVGFTASLAKAYQLRWEFRDNVVNFVTATGPSTGLNSAPPQVSRYKHLLSMMIGFDVVLEKRRGRRY